MEQKPILIQGAMEDEIALIKELRMHIKLYERLLEDPKRTMDYIEKKLR